MNSSLRHWAARIGSRPLLARPATPRTPVVLIYHGVPRHDAPVDAEVFESHMRFLQHHFEPVSVDELHSRRAGLGRIRVLLTFDDGFRNNAEIVAPILRRYRIPAVFFACSRHAKPKRFLWFSYLRALQRWFRGNGFLFRGEFMDMSPAHRGNTIDRLRKALLALEPHPSAMYQAIENECPELSGVASSAEFADHYEGMSAEQIGELAADPLFEIGIHTADHPYLSKCDPAEIGRQIADNKQWIEAATGRACRLIAYPGGDYNASTLAQCERLRLRYGFSDSLQIPGNPELQLRRVGIYQPSLDELGFKVCCGGILRRLQGHGYFINN